MKKRKPASSGNTRKSSASKTAPPASKAAVKSAAKPASGPAPRETGRLRRILVPVDFSDHSRDALRYAVDIGSVFDAELVLLYVVESVGYPADLGYPQVAMPEIERDLAERARTELERLLRMTVGERLPARLQIAAGRPFIEIIRAAKDLSVDLIIIATHGRTGVENILFGSTAEKVVRKAPCPVLVVR